MIELAQLLADGRVHVMDGAMGTMLYAQGVFVNVCYDELNLTHPDLVSDVHEQYIRAGAEVIETNTFGANPVKLASYGLDERAEEINRRAAEIACQAAGGRAAVVGAVGPLGVRVEPLGPTGLEEARDLFGRQVDGLIAGGVGGFILETFSDLAELEQAFRAIRERSELPVLAEITIGEDCLTSYGTSVEQAATAATAWGVDAVGLNCSVGPAVILDGLERMAEVTDLPLVAQPNAGLPRTVGDRKMYLAGPDYMAQYALRLIDAGARFVGGCCGTTPDHVRRIRESVAALQPKTPSVRVVRDAERSASRGAPTPLGDRSRLGRKLATGEWITAVQTRPPRGWDPSALVQDCRQLANAGVDLVSLYEDRRTSRLGVMAAARLVLQRCAIEPVVHYTCQSRTMFDMISDLLGAAAGDVRNLLLVSGDPPLGGPYREFASVIDIDSIGLTNVVTGLNSGVDASGNDIGDPTEFVIGVALNQGARDPVREAERLFWKADAGAHYAVTQPVFDAGQLFDFLERQPGLTVADHRRHLATPVPPTSRVPPERGPWRVRAGPRRRAHEGGRRSGTRGRHGRRHRLGAGGLRGPGRSGPGRARRRPRSGGGHGTRLPGCALRLGAVLHEATDGRQAPRSAPWLQVADVDLLRPHGPQLTNRPCTDLLGRGSCCELRFDFLPRDREEAAEEVQGPGVSAAVVEDAIDHGESDLPLLDEALEGLNPVEGMVGNDLGEHEVCGEGRIGHESDLFLGRSVGIRPSTEGKSRHVLSENPAKIASMGDASGRADRRVPSDHGDPGYTEGLGSSGEVATVVQAVLTRQEGNHRPKRRAAAQVRAQMGQTLLLRVSHGIVGEEHQCVRVDESPNPMVHVDPHVDAPGRVKAHSRRAKLHGHGGTGPPQGPGRLTHRPSATSRATSAGAVGNASVNTSLPSSVISTSSSIRTPIPSSSGARPQVPGRK